MPKSNVSLLKFIPAWITPNGISLLRLAMIPIIVTCLGFGFFLFALALFLIAALLDALDGALARARNQISDWGMIIDPLADKLLIIAIAVFLFIYYPFRSIIAYVFIFDFLIIIAAAFKVRKSQPGTGSPITASNIWGKSKMLAQVTGVSLALLWLAWPIAPLLYASALILWLSLALQIISAVTYSG